MNRIISILGILLLFAAVGCTYTGTGNQTGNATGDITGENDTTGTGTGDVTDDTENDTGDTTGTITGEGTTDEDIDANETTDNVTEDTENETVTDETTEDNVTETGTGGTTSTGTTTGAGGDLGLDRDCSQIADELNGMSVYHDEVCTVVVANNNNNVYTTSDNVDVSKFGLLNTVVEFKNAGNDEVYVLGQTTYRGAESTRVENMIDSNTNWRVLSTSTDAEINNQEVTMVVWEATGSLDTILSGIGDLMDELPYTGTSGSAGAGNRTDDNGQICTPGTIGC